MEDYNGWTNYETWNVALWIGNEPPFYQIAIDSKDYNSFCETLRESGILKTPDQVALNDSRINIDEVDELLFSMTATAY
tara:strand:+ start:756 stop:992 length:237 start_codon:yes stop_codon:yes gene_type:complete